MERATRAGGITDRIGIRERITWGFYLLVDESKVEKGTNTEQSQRLGQIE